MALKRHCIRAKLLIVSCTLLSSLITTGAARAATDPTGRESAGSDTVVNTAPLWPEAYYRIYARNSGGVIDLPANEQPTTSHDVPIEQYSYNGGENQLWRPVLHHESGGVQYYVFREKNHYNTCLKASPIWSFPESLVASTCANDAGSNKAFLFHAEHAGDGWWSWQSASTDHYWEVFQASAEAKAPIVLREKGTGWSQQFLLYFTQNAPGVSSAGTTK
ncbi:RICIN domain-containing protein [Streptomyces sp. NPDC099088]|uniref:RICIN domain-containing protein n=1 Tax=Streptomyces sp. NPDC099088 TaxID=3366101 RepID=UPI00380E58C3